MQLFTFFVCLLTTFSLTAQIINIEDRRLKHADTIAFHSTGDLGFNFYKNDKRLITARTGLQLEYQRYRHIWMFYSGYNLIHSEGAANVQNEAYVHLRYNFRLPKLWTFEVYNQAQYNERTRSKLRALIGSGIRLRLHHGKSNRFYFGVSTMYEYAEFKDLERINRDLRLSNYFTCYLKLSPQLSFAQTTYFQPIIIDFSNRRLSSEGVLVFNVSQHFKLQSRASISYDNDPRLPEIIPDVVYAWTSGLRFEF